MIREKEKRPSAHLGRRDIFVKNCGQFFFAVSMLSR